MSVVYFFGYGANRNRQKISQIIGRDPGEGVGAIVEGHILCVQNLQQIPNPPRDFLTELYGNEFKAYTLRKGEGLIQGIVWQLSQEDIQKIKEWEFVGIWREITEISVVTSKLIQTTVVTEKASDNQDYMEVVDGLLYDEFKFIRQSPQQNQIGNQYYTQQQIDKIQRWLENQVKTSPQVPMTSSLVGTSKEVKDFLIKKSS